MRKTLIVVDMQNDFIDGALGTSEAASIVENVKKKIKEYSENGGEIIFTRDTHYDDYLETNEGKHLPVPHCIEGTKGWEIREGLEVENATYINKNSQPFVPSIQWGTKGWEIREGLEVENATYINKNSFGYTGWGDFDLEEVELVGLCTDICVVSNALLIKAIYPEINVTVDSSCCAGVTPERHRAALDTMRSCQVNVI